MALDTNDFIGSFADENVKFGISVLHTTSVGDNYWKLMVFVENDRFVDTTQEGWELIPNSSTIKAVTVNADNYAEYTNDLLQSWLYDFFANGFDGDAILVACSASEATVSDSDAFVAAMEEAYAKLKPYAYHKTVLAGKADGVAPEYAVALAKLCAADQDLLSAAPYFPCTNKVLASDEVYTALKNVSTDAYMVYHTDTTRNGALYSLGLALSVLNETGTSVGNTIDMAKSSNITASENGESPASATKTTLSNAHIGYFKPIGDNSGDVAEEGGYTINGVCMSAYWIRAYITYMAKVYIARVITTVNFRRTNKNYNKIIDVVKNYVNLFGSADMLSDVTFSFPSFADLPNTGSRSFTIYNAWSATYLNNITQVRITGNLTIGEE